VGSILMSGLPPSLQHLEAFIPLIYNNIQRISNLIGLSIQSVSLNPGITSYFSVCITNSDHTDIRNFDVCFVPETSPEEVNKLVMDEVLRQCGLTLPALTKVDLTVFVSAPSDKEWDII